MLGTYVKANGDVNANAAVARGNLGEDEVTTNQIGSRGPRLLLISESGLYKLIMRSDKPQARALPDWVTREVLPSTRKTGAYVTGQPSIAENPKMDPSGRPLRGFLVSG